MLKEAENQKGQSLVEVVVAVAVAIIIVLALVGVTTVSIRNAAAARNQALATQYAQEGMEEARRLRDENPTAFFSGSCPSSGAVGTLPFQRTISCDPANGETKRVVTVIVSWTDSSGTHKSELKSYLTKWK
jgi:Tfp pilus assembly protein PilV